MFESLSLFAQLTSLESFIRSSQTALALPDSDYRSLRYHYPYPTFSCIDNGRCCLDNRLPNVRIKKTACLVLACIRRGVDPTKIHGNPVSLGTAVLVRQGVDDVHSDFV
jgi:hypothetical protein